MKKRGELTSSEIITLVLIIAGFAIVLLFVLVVIDVKEYEADQLCKLSVITRATAPDPAQRLAPLKCTTKKICISNGEDCNEFIGEENKIKIDLSSYNQAEKTEMIEKITANSMFDCWNMMGQGKLDLFGGGKTSSLWSSAADVLHLEKDKSSCVICSRVALGKDLEERVITNVDVNTYMEDTIIPVEGATETYLQTFTDRQIQSYPADFRTDFTNVKGQKTNQIGILFMQIITQDKPLEAGLDTAAYTGSFVMTGAKGLGPIGILAWKPALALSTVTAAGTGVAAWFQTYRSRQVSMSYCGPLKKANSEDPEDGCSIFTGIDYNQIGKINQFCSRIEGQP